MNVGIDSEIKNQRHARSSHPLVALAGIGTFQSSSSCKSQSNQICDFVFFHPLYVQSPLPTLLPLNSQKKKE